VPASQDSAFQACPKQPIVSICRTVDEINTNVLCRVMLIFFVYLFAFSGNHIEFNKIAFVYLVRDTTRSRNKRRGPGRKGTSTVQDSTPVSFTSHSLGNFNCNRYNYCYSWAHSLFAEIDCGRRCEKRGRV
jgi:hypothetical protein